jgi:hypothetical protein
VMCQAAGGCNTSYHEKRNRARNQRNQASPVQGSTSCKCQRTRQR